MNKPRRRISPDTFAALAGTIVRQHESLPPDSPRRKPSLPRLCCLESDPDQPEQPAEPTAEEGRAMKVAAQAAAPGADNDEIVTADRLVR
jgi:hypothetical protein